VLADPQAQDVFGAVEVTADLGIIGVNAETLRNWIRIDDGDAPTRRTSGMLVYLHTVPVAQGYDAGTPAASSEAWSCSARSRSSREATHIFNPTRHRLIRARRSTAMSGQEENNHGA
jgi:hypothetical protein